MSIHTEYIGWERALVIVGILGIAFCLFGIFFPSVLESVFTQIHWFMLG